MAIVGGGDDGYEVTPGKAAEIVASGGWVTVLALEMKEGVHYMPVPGMRSRVQGTPRHRKHGEPLVNTSGTGDTPADRALLHSEVEATAARLARRSLQVADPFASVPPWVKAELGDRDWNAETVSYNAARSYQDGNLTLAGAWRCAITYEKTRDCPGVTEE
jgi:hypothetical protein